MTHPHPTPTLAPVQTGNVRTSSLERIALTEALGVTDTSVIDVLHAHGLRAVTAFVLEWLPAVDVCWVDGADAGEQNALRVQLAADDRATVGALELLDQWLTTRPLPEHFEAARRAIRLQLRDLDEDGRRATLDRVVAICEAAGRASGASVGVAALSTRERRHIRLLRRELEDAV